MWTLVLCCSLEWFLWVYDCLWPIAIISEHLVCAVRLSDFCECTIACDRQRSYVNTWSVLFAWVISVSVRLPAIDSDHMWTLGLCCSLEWFLWVYDCLRSTAIICEHLVCAVCLSDFCECAIACDRQWSYVKLGLCCSLEWFLWVCDCLRSTVIVYEHMVCAVCLSDFCECAIACDRQWSDVGQPLVDQNSYSPNVPQGLFIPRQMSCLHRNTSGI